MTKKLIPRIPVTLRMVLVTIVASVGMLLGASDAKAGGPAVWVGNPLSATFGIAGDWSTHPANHHKLVKASPQNDFGVDLSNTGSGPGVYLYVAPSDTSLNNRITTVVAQLVDDATCRTGGGGDFVTVSVRLDGNEVGRVTYAHLDRNGSLYVGKPIPRWGSLLGTVANLYGGGSGGSGCWTGPHVHLEMRATSGYACWNRGWALGQRMNPTNFLGFVSGPMLPSGRSAACP